MGLSTSCRLAAATWRFMCCTSPAAAGVSMVTLRWAPQYCSCMLRGLLASTCGAVAGWAGGKRERCLWGGAGCCSAQHACQRTAPPPHPHSNPPPALPSCPQKQWLLARTCITTRRPSTSSTCRLLQYPCCRCRCCLPPAAAASGATCTTRPGNSTSRAPPAAAAAPTIPSPALRTVTCVVACRSPAACTAGCCRPPALSTRCMQPSPASSREGCRRSCSRTCR